MNPTLLEIEALVELAITKTDVLIHGTSNNIQHDDLFRLRSTLSQAAQITAHCKYAHALNQ